MVSELASERDSLNLSLDNASERRGIDLRGRINDAASLDFYSATNEKDIDQVGWIQY
jgi:hypothetical protein